jgi:pyruvate,water dikinase
LAAAGSLPEAADVFWLEDTELDAAVTQMAAGLPVTDHGPRVTERKSLNRAASRATPPPQVPFKGKYMGMSTEVWTPVHAGDQADDLIRGVGASPGKVTAPARVLLGPEQFAEMQPGDILVAGITTPAWTPLFAMASAVVTDVGGPLSHGSIVAREYGIPAVMGTGIATARIKSGEVVTVDGSAGTVRLSDGASA